MEVRGGGRRAWARTFWAQFLFQVCDCVTHSTGRALVATEIQSSLFMQANILKFNNIVHLVIGDVPSTMSIICLNGRLACLNTT